MRTSHFLFVSVCDSNFV